MLYKMIERKCQEWYSSKECEIVDLINYMNTKGKMRDVQLEAIKVYLFLKIKCQCRPLNELFKEGFFNSIDINELEVATSTRDYLSHNPAAVALLEYVSLKNGEDKTISSEIEEAIRKHPESIDYGAFFDAFFYGVNYSDYLFSLPMGAGKTYLMAAFIYLDLYFAINEPNNPVFAHNFVLFAPSGLKASVLPSLKTIQRFDPSWILPEPAASNIKRRIIFEVLDQEKSKKKSNKTKNPNVQKIARHQPLSELFGLVAVTNAEKVILDRIQESDGALDFLDESEDDKDRQANELRNMVGKLPFLSVFIDEVHHAVSEEIKLRAVINRWMENGNINSVIGFSGTPYLDSVEKTQVTEKLMIGTAEITNIVYYYPLVKGIGNFLKTPIVKIESNSDSKTIIENGLKEFLDNYKDTVYSDGTCAKLAIYCGTIEKLEKVVYPLVLKAVKKYKIKANQVLKFHQGNKKYPQPIDSKIQFDMLDNPLSKIRIILLVQIGKEGWDCRSLTGVILSQEGDCPNNMVLQTSCRCLREVIKAKDETALIYINEGNSDKLNVQLDEQQHITVKEFQQGSNSNNVIKRYNRMDRLKVPKVDFYQLRIRQETVTLTPVNTQEEIITSADDAYIGGRIIQTTDFSMKNLGRVVDDTERGDKPTTFYAWINGISKAGFGTPTVHDLLEHKDELEQIYEKISYENNGVHFYSSKYDRKKIEACIRKAFVDKRTFETKEELIPEEASLLNIQNFTNEIMTSKVGDFYPDSIVVKKIISDDNGDLKPDQKTEQLINLAIETGNIELANEVRNKYVSHINKDSSFHYLPYRTDSEFEQTFLKEILSLEDIRRLGLEVYYNGDGSLTEFRIKCYKKEKNKWIYLGIYTPDFLIIQRQDKKIKKIIIVETKGQIYANDPCFAGKMQFMKEYFTPINNQQYGYDRFEYLYLEDTLSDEQRIVTTHDIITKFFSGGTETCQ